MVKQGPTPTRELRPRSRPSRLDWMLGVGGYLALMAVSLFPIWSGRVEPIWDGADFNHPSLAFASDALRAGHLPLWDPFTNAGQPFFADPQLAWYQPAALLAALASGNHLQTYLLYWTSVWIWAGLGAFLLAAVLGARPLGCLVAASSFALSGFFIGHAEHLPHLTTAAWVPWVIALAHASVSRANPGLAVLGGVALGLSALGGYPGVVIFEVLALASWLALAFLVPSTGPAVETGEPFRTRCLRAGFAFGIAVVLLLLVWSPGLVAFFRVGAGYTSQIERPSVQAALYGNTFSMRAMLSLFAPRLVTLVRGYFPADVSMNDAYVGALAVPLLAAWLATGLRRTWWLVTFVLLWAWMSLGGNGGLRNLVDLLLPATRFMRYSAVLRVFAVLGLAVGAGLGADACASSFTSGRRARVAVAAWLVLGLGAVALHADGLGIPLMDLVTPFVLACAAAIALLSWKEGTTRPVVVAVGLAAIVAVDVAAHLRLDPSTVWVEEERVRRIERLPRNPDPARPRLDLGVTRAHLLVRVPVVEGFVSLSSTYNSVLAPSRFRSVLVAHRYWLSPVEAPEPPEGAGLAALARADADGPVPVLVSGEGAPIPPGAFVVPGTFGRTTLESYEDGQVAMTVVVPDGPGAVLASTERFAADWQVRVDGVPRPLLRVNYFFRGVRVPPGVHRVVFDYDPSWFAPLLVGGYAVAVLGALFGAILAWRVERRPPGIGTARARNRL